MLKAFAFLEERLPKIIKHIQQEFIVFLADIVLQFLPLYPVDVPLDGPWFRISTWIINLRHIVQHFLEWTSNTFDCVQLFSVHMAIEIQPCFFVVSNGIDDKRVAFPLS